MCSRAIGLHAFSFPIIGQIFSASTTYLWHSTSYSERTDVPLIFWTFIFLKLLYCRILIRFDLVGLAYL